MEVNFRNWGKTGKNIKLNWKLSNLLLCKRNKRNMKQAEMCLAGS